MTVGKKPIQKIVLKADGSVDVDILNGAGSSCAKEMKEWEEAFGGGASVTKKPEFYKQTKKTENLNTQTG